MKLKAAVWLNIASALCGFTGVVLSLIVNGPSCLAMYTDEVALFSGIISIIFSIKVIQVPKNDCKVYKLDSLTSKTGLVRSSGSNFRGTTPFSHTLLFCRFASAVMQIVLIIAALISFLPVFQFPFNVLSPHLLLMHFAAPILSLISYFAFEPKGSLQLRDTLYSMIYTFLYAAAAIGITASGVYHSEAYPFLNYYPGHIAAPILEDLAILLAVYLIDYLVYRIKRTK